MGAQRKKGKPRVAKNPHKKEDLLRHQAVKELMRAAKATKTNLIRRAVRKCKLLREDAENEEKYSAAVRQLENLKKFKQDSFQSVAQSLIYGDQKTDVDNANKIPSILPGMEGDEISSVNNIICQQKFFRDAYDEQMRKILLSQAGDSKQQRPDDSSSKKETVRQKHKQNVGVFIESLDSCEVKDAIPLLRKKKNRGTQGVHRHLRESHKNDRKLRDGPDLSAYMPHTANTANSDRKDTVNHGKGTSSRNKEVGIHPSWLAKQKLKSQKAVIGKISLVTNSSNKITFENDND